MRVMGWHGKIADAALEDFYSNHCVDGECTHCGECCADLLPLTPGELEIIRRYVKKHKIKEHRQAPFWDRNATDLTCPFRNQQTKRCDIYQVRPYICKEFICRKSLLDARKDRDLIHKDRKVYSLRWEIFENPECLRLLTSACAEAVRRFGGVL